MARRKRTRKTRAASTSSSGRVPVYPPLEDLIRILPGFDPYVQAGDCYFDPEAAKRPIAFFSRVLRLPVGTKYVRAGEPFIPRPWQAAILANVWGWRRPDGTRRFREVFVYVPKKNGKSAFVGGFVLCVLCIDGEEGAELYSAASSRDQAALVWGYARGMVGRHPSLSKRLRVYGGRAGQARSIVYADLDATWKVLASDANTADGVNPHLAAIDELHRHKTPELAEVLEKSTIARREPLVVTLTTADYDRPSLCNTKLAQARRVLANPGDPNLPGWDPALLPVVYEATADDDWRDPEVWRRVNPNLGVTVAEEELARQARKAAESPVELSNFLRLHLNVVTQADVAWINLERWDECAGEPTIEGAGGLEAWIKAKGLEGRRCYAGLDLAKTTDSTAAVLAFPPEAEGDRWILLPFVWIPKATAHRAEERDRVPYSAWEALGLVEFTEGEVTDFDHVEKRLLDLARRFRIAELAFDPWSATQLATHLRDDGVEVVEFRQGFASMSEPAKELERLYLRREIEHGGNPLLRSAAANVMVKTDPAGNVKLDKSKSTGRIDAMVGAVMAVGRGIMGGTDSQSVYEERGPFIG